MSIISIKHIAKSFGTFRAVDDISIEVAAGETVGLLGVNGAGKTTLIKMLCWHWGVKETVNSPTFSLVNQYSTEGAEVGDVLFHIDLYRLKNEEEAFDAGIEEHLFSGHLCLVEWPEKAIGIIPDNTLRVEITTQDHEQRHIRVVSGEN